jgi:hypothetical protein
MPKKTTTRKTPQRTKPVPVEAIAYSIHVLRGEKVLLDADLAALYGVETKTLNRAVKRNLNRFPPDFMFQLTQKEFDDSSRYQIGTSNNPTLKMKGRGGRQYLPYAFTEQGVAMLSSVLNSKQAVAVNIEIMRVFVRVRQLLSTNDELQKRLAEVEKAQHSAQRTQEKHTKSIETIMEVIRQLLAEPDKPKKKNPIGFTKD